MVVSIQEHIELQKYERLRTKLSVTALRASAIAQARSSKLLDGLSRTFSGRIKSYRNNCSLPLDKSAALVVPGQNYPFSGSTGRIYNALLHWAHTNSPAKTRAPGMRFEFNFSAVFVEKILLSAGGGSVPFYCWEDCQTAS